MRFMSQNRLPPNGAGASGDDFADTGHQLGAPPKYEAERPIVNIGFKGGPTHNRVR